MSGKRSTGINVGGSSILVIFVLLCLTTFATLSMVSANADYKLTQKTADASLLFYEADAAAEEILSEIDGMLTESRGNESTANDYFRDVMSRIELREDITVARTADATLTLGYQVEMSEQQALSVEIAVMHPLPKEGPLYQIKSWKVVNTAPLDMEDEALGLWTGDAVPAG